MKKRLLLSIFVLLLFIPVSYASADTPAPGGPFSTTLTLRNKESYQVSCVFTVYQNDGWVVFNSNEIILTVNDWEYVNVPDLALDQGAGYSVVVNCSGNVAISQNFADLDSGASFRGSTPSTSWYLPGLYDNYYNYYSTVFVQNAVGTDISATLQVYPSGSTTPVYQETRTIKAYESESFQLEGKGELIQNQTYSGKVTSTGNSLSIVSTYGRSSANNQLYAYNGFTAGSRTFYAPVVMNNYYGYNSALVIQWAFISTPATAPFNPTSKDHVGAFTTQQSHSVTTEGGPILEEATWAQVGWLYIPGYSQPQKYWEYRDTSKHQQLQTLGAQVWNTSVKYEVSHNGNQEWCVWISGALIQCFPNTDSAPVRMQAQAEVHYDPNTRIDTSFSGIRVKYSSNGNWDYGPDINSNLGKDFPYLAVSTATDAFSASRRATLDRFVPLLTQCNYAYCYYNP